MGKGIVKGRLIEQSGLTQRERDTRPELPERDPVLAAVVRRPRLRVDAVDVFG